MERETILREIEYLSQRTQGPFPYEDIRTMKKHERLASHFEALGDNDWLTADFNTYCMCVAGIASRILRGTEDNTPQKALEWLALGDFFTIFPKYRFFEDEWTSFSKFAHLYSSTKRMQELELAFLLSSDELLALKTDNPRQGWDHFLGPVTVITLDEDNAQNDVKNEII